MPDNARGNCNWLNNEETLIINNENEMNSEFLDTEICPKGYFYCHLWKACMLVNETENCEWASVEKNTAMVKKENDGENFCHNGFVWCPYYHRCIPANLPWGCPSIEKKEVFSAHTVFP